MTYKVKVYETYQETEVLALYLSVGWTNYTQDPDMLRLAFKHSLKIFAAYVRERLVGIIRAVGDGYSVVFVQDLLIHPEFQRLGIGRVLLNHIQTEFSDVYQLHLMTENTEKTLSFYRSLGFEPVSEMAASALTWIRK